jgi:hypothetical protein
MNFLLRLIFLGVFVLACVILKTNPIQAFGVGMVTLAVYLLGLTIYGTVSVYREWYVNWGKLIAFLFLILVLLGIGVSIYLAGGK